MSNQEMNQANAIVVSKSDKLLKEAEECRKNFYDQFAKVELAKSMDEIENLKRQQKEAHEMYENKIKEANEKLDSLKKEIDDGTFKPSKDFTHELHARARQMGKRY